MVNDPCAFTWQGFEIAYRFRSARYEIAVENPNGVSRGVASWTIDAVAQPTGSPVRLSLVDDDATHHVRVILGESK